MKHLRRVLAVILLSFFVFIPAASKSQDISEYTLISDEKTMTFIPRPDLGYVIQPSENESAAQTFQSMLSSIKTVENRKIKGLNKRNLTVVTNLDKSINSASTILQSQSRSGYKAPLFSVNGQTIAIIPEIVVRLAFENAYDSLQSVCNDSGLTIKQKLESSQNEYLIEVNGLDENAVFDAVNKLNQNAFIEWAFPNIASQPILAAFIPADSNETEKVIPDDEYFSHLWHLYNTGQTNGTAGADINATDAWKITTGDPNIVIAVIDSGVDIYHPDLINNIVPGYDFVDDDNDASPSLINIYDAHGTMCAGLAAAHGNNKIGVTGVAWNCKIMPVKIADDDVFIADSDIAAAIRWAAQNGADILSNSWGNGYPTPIVRSAIRDVTTQGGIGRDGKGCVVCCSAGNSGEEGGKMSYPAVYSEVIAVGATDHEDMVLSYSSYGQELDIVAPSGGTDFDYALYETPYLWTTDITGIDGYSIVNIDPSILDYSDSMNGTSGSCPIAAGAAALVLSVDPNLTNIQVRAILLESAHDLGEHGKDNYYGYGRVDANAAVIMAFNPPDIAESNEITLFVDDDAPNDPCANNPDLSDPNEDGTLEHPFDSIQKAIDYAISTETIIVLPGTYIGTGNYNIDLFGKSLKIYSETGPEECIIDCQKLGRGFYLHNKETLETEISGFTITKGQAINGGGIYCTNDSSPEITNCIISNCNASAWGNLGGEGGGIYIDNDACPILMDCNFAENESSWYGGGISTSNCNPTLINCIFSRNISGDMGGGIYNYYGIPLFMDCNFFGNSAETDGGAIYNEEGYPYLLDCILSLNKAITSSGGAIYNYYGDVYIQNCILNNNSAGASGAGIYNTYGYYGTYLINCAFYNNMANDSGGAICSDESYFLLENCTLTQNNANQGKAIACDSTSWMSYGSYFEISNSIIWDGTDSIANLDNSEFYISYSDIKKAGTGKWTGIGNINKDPFFADPNNSDFHLKSEGGRWNPETRTWLLDDVTSPCINAGDPDSDVADEPAPNGNRINLGFYGGTSEASMSSSGGIDPNDPNAMTKAYNPNPENNSYCYDSSTTLSWTAGDFAIKHDVYLGTNIGTVTNATRDNPLGLLKSKAQTSTSYNTGFLNNFMTYYWRIDEVLADNTIVKGDVWTFIVYVKK